MTERVNRMRLIVYMTAVKMLTVATTAMGFGIIGRLQIRPKIQKPPISCLNALTDFGMKS